VGQYKTRPAAPHVKFLKKLKKIEPIEKSLEFGRDPVARRSLGLQPLHRALPKILVTAHCDSFLGPLERARAETGRADQWVLKLWEFPVVARVNCNPEQFSVE